MKGGRKSGEFVEQKDVENMEKCTQKCCNDPDRKCNLAFMLGKACYSVKCDSPELCQTVKAPSTKFNPVVQYVRGLTDIDAGISKSEKETKQESDGPLSFVLQHLLVYLVYYTAVFIK